MLKEHKGKVSASVIFAIIGVGLGVIPYFSVASIINNLVEKNTGISNYVPYILAVLVGFLGSILFHEISTIMSHNLAYRIIEDRRKLLADKLSRISMGEVEKKSSGQWSQFMVETHCSRYSGGNCQYSHSYRTGCNHFYSRLENRNSQFTHCTIGIPVFHVDDARLRKKI